jgi:hypothetical protein
VTLCAYHHLRGVHGGRLRIRGRAPHALRFELGLRAGGAPLAVYASGDRRLAVSGQKVGVGGSCALDSGLGDLSRLHIR